MGNVRSPISWRDSICPLVSACLFVTHSPVKQSQEEGEICVRERKEQRHVLSHQAPHTTARERFLLLWGVSVYASTLAAGREGCKEHHFSLNLRRSQWHPKEGTQLGKEERRTRKGREILIWVSLKSVFVGYFVLRRSGKLSSHSPLPLRAFRGTHSS